MPLYISVGYIIVMAQTLTSPKSIVPLAYDTGGVTTSTVTVPVVAALGLGLAASIPGRSPLIDGFGLIAFASVCPIMSVLAYVWLAARLRRRKGVGREPRNAMNLKLIFALVADDRTDAVLDAARAAGATGATVITSCRGEGLTPERSFLGLELTAQRDILLFLVAEPKAREILETIAQAGKLETNPEPASPFRSRSRMPSDCAPRPAPCSARSRSGYERQQADDRPRRRRDEPDGAQDHRSWRRSPKRIEADARRRGQFAGGRAARRRRRIRADRRHRHRPRGDRQRSRRPIGSMSTRSCPSRS